MTVSKNFLLSKLRKDMFPAIDDPRQEFKRKLQKQLRGNLGVAAGLRSKPKTSRPGRGGVRTGRPARPGSGT